MKLAGLKSLESTHEDSIWATTWFPPSSTRPYVFLLTGSLDEMVKVWRTGHNDDDIVLECTNVGHSLGVVSVAVHPSGVIATSAALDSLVKVFDVDTNRIVATLEAPPSESWQMQFNPMGILLAISGGSRASDKVWDTATWKLVSTHTIPISGTSKPSDKTATKKFTLSVAWSPDARLLACGSMDGTITVFDMETRRFLHFLEGHLMPVRTLAFSPVDPRVLFPRSDNGHIHMYDSIGKSLIGLMSGHSSWVLSLDASQDGSAIASGSSDKFVKLWDLGMRAAAQSMIM